MTTPTKQSTDNLYRVCRGGSRNNTSATFVRVAFRDGVSPLLRNNDFGFRCAQRGCRQQVLKVTP